MMLPGAAVMPPVCFVVRARADSQTLGRVIDHFAQRGQVLRRITAEVDGEFLTVVIEQEGFDDQQAAIVAEKMRASVLIESVQLTRGGRPILPLGEYAVIRGTL